MNQLIKKLSGYQRLSDVHDPHLESRNEKLDFIRASNWIGGGECDDAYYETIDVEKPIKIGQKA